MEISNGKYNISINRNSNEPYYPIDVRLYDCVFDPYGYMGNEFKSAFNIKIQSEFETRYIALVGSFYSMDNHCAVLNEDELTVLMDDIIVRLDIPSLKITAQEIVGDFIYFSVYPVDKDYIVHGELEILRLDSNFKRLWSFGGSDIFVTPNNRDESFQMTENQILLEDWNGVKYALDMNGNLLWDTYEQ